MPASHAKLSPSGAERWISCPASIRLSDQVPPEAESEYAREGTVAHELAYLKAALRFGHIDQAKYEKDHAAWQQDNRVTGDQLLEMTQHCNEWVEVLAQFHQDLQPVVVTQLEMRLDSGVPGVWGTTDAALIGEERIIVADFKYGAGVAVSPGMNPQLLLYALGCLDTYGDALGETQEVTLVIFQPRAGDGLPKTFTLSAAELRAWRTEVASPAAALAGQPDAPFGPSETACRWCPAAGICRARMDLVLEDFEVYDPYSAPDLLSEEEVGEMLGKLKHLRAWCDALEEYALDAIYSRGKAVPGWKVVQTTGRRTVLDHEAAIEKLAALGYRKSSVSETKVLALGKLEKLLKPRDLVLGDVLGDSLGKTEGRPALVPDTDKRPSIDPYAQAAEDFKEE